MALALRFEHFAKLADQGDHAALAVLGLTRVERSASRVERTPRGPFEVLELHRHPVWRVPRSIQHEMAMQGKVVKTVVPPGPHNPLGDYFIALPLGNLEVHTTNAPLTIYGFRTHGCIRLNPDDARALF